jgi:alpha-ketoglutarate-dependent taurine dioxygenase
VPFASALGAEIKGLDLRRLDDTDFRVLYKTYLDHLLVLVRDQELSDVDQVNVARRFGALELPPAAAERSSHQHYDGPPEITVVSNIRVNGVPIGELGDGEVIWHSDYSFREVIGGMRMLRAVKLPPAGAGGDTQFCNGYAAYDDLPESLKRIVHGRTIKHDTAYDTNRNLRRGAQEVTDIRYSPGPSHPIVSTHPETGCNSLFLGRRLKHYVNGYPFAESEALLDELWAHMLDERHIVTHVWRAGDVVIWDNRCTLHRRGPFDPHAQRELHATQVRGHRPYEAPDARSRPPHPRVGLSRADR